MVQALPKGSTSYRMSKIQRPGKMAKPQETSGTSLTVRMASLPAAERTAILDKAIQRYGDGESVYQIAAELGIEHTTLYRHLVREKEDQWVEAKRAKALAEVEEAEEGLRNARDPLALSRARERFRAATWHLERLWRRIYGQDAPTNVSQVVINVQQIRGEPLDVVAETDKSTTPNIEVIEPKQDGPLDDSDH